MPYPTLSYSDADGQHTVVVDRSSTSIGRSPSQDVVLRDPATSRQHAVILRDGDTCTVVDQNSTHGTFLNGVRVKRAVLAPEDVLQMGSLKGPSVRFHLQQNDETANTAFHLPVNDLLASLRDFQIPAGTPAGDAPIEISVAGNSVTDTAVVAVQ